MPYLVDTSVLMRLANSSDIQYVIAEQAVKALQQRSELLHIAPQNLIEFRSGSTRPVEVNGLGLSSGDVELKSEAFEKKFSLLPETPEIYPAWKSLVQAAGVTGRQVHDARLVAICHVYGISHIRTFNIRHFTRLATFAPGVVILDLASIW